MAKYVKTRSCYVISLISSRFVYFFLKYDSNTLLIMKYVNGSPFRVRSIPWNLEKALKMKIFFSRPWKPWILANYLEKSKNYLEKANRKKGKISSKLHKFRARSYIILDVPRWHALLGTKFYRQFFKYLAISSAYWALQ